MGFEAVDRGIEGSCLGSYRMSLIFFRDFSAYVCTLTRLAEAPLMAKDFLRRKWTRI